MEVLSVLIRKAVEGGYISGCNIRRGNGPAAIISHLLFADDTIVFCEAKKDYLTYLSWILMWFEAASGLRINLEKSEVIPVGEVEDVAGLAAELGCKAGQLPSVYLGLPLGAPNKSSYMWDGVEERMRGKLALWKRQYISKGGRITLIKSTLASMPLYHLSLFRMPKVVARRLEKLQRDFLWGGGNLERKAHLVNWEAVCMDKEKGGLGLRKLVPLNKALLGKWVWRFAKSKDELWKQVLLAKYGQEDFGWRTKKVNGALGVGVWKEIMKEADWCWENMVFNVGKGTRIRFWSDPWCGGEVLSHRFFQLFDLAANKNATVGDVWDQNSRFGGWNLRFLRAFNDWEMHLVADLLQVLSSQRVNVEEDSVFWKDSKNGQFGAKKAYSLLISPNGTSFPKKEIWVERVPTKLVFFAWEATWGKALTLDRLQKRGWQLPNRCFLCGCEEENIDHLLIHCTVARVLWEMVLGLFGVQWVFPNSVKEVIISWKGSFVGKKRRKIWRSIPLYIFWMVWMERNRLAFRGGMLAIQKLKNSFVCNLWGCAKLYSGVESRSLIGFLEWLASY
ncbi:hypothetical protein PVL29_008009 [Vitis rotundifolia]|uniref:Reverse transcriptase zinc-binding domain-containing protein n=1 Tax=Vitis rotundifolia TaxID=103349 RepID=A0AA39A1L4_VITRO|nr:hypothetical protein PVL29_008009 [Vitis rotundifolia]